MRIAWVFGVNGHNFIKTMLKVGSNHDEVKVVDDQIGTPTYTFDLARLLVDMIETDKYGYYHATNSELPEPKAVMMKMALRPATFLGTTLPRKSTVKPVTTLKLRQ